MISGYWPGATVRAAPQANQLLVRSEFPGRALATFARPLLARAAGAPKGFPLTFADAGNVVSIVDSMVRVVPRAEGVIFDLGIGPIVADEVGGQPDPEAGSSGYCFLWHSSVRR